MNNYYQQFINKECLVQLNDREETQVNAKILCLDSIGVIATYTTHNKEYKIFVPLERLSYIENKSTAE